MSHKKTVAFQNECLHFFHLHYSSIFYGKGLKFELEMDLLFFSLTEFFFSQLV